MRNRRDLKKLLTLNYGENTLSINLEGDKYRIGERCT